MFATPIAVTAPAVPQAKVEAAHEPHLASLGMFFSRFRTLLADLECSKALGPEATA